MTEIPEDIMRAARVAAAAWYSDTAVTMSRMHDGKCDSWPVVRVAATAILAERERAAKVADDIAAAIRGGSQ